MNHGPSREKRVLLGGVPLILATLIVAIAFFSLWQVIGVKADFLQKTTLATPKPLPDLRVTQLIYAACAECWSPASLAATLSRQAKVSGETVSSSSEAGRSLVKKYGIVRAPTLIVTGSTEDSRLAAFFAQGWKSQADARIFVGQEPVYYNPQTYEVTGKVSLLQIRDPSCANCSDLSALGGQLKKAGVFIGSERIVNSTSEEGIRLIEKYRPQALPFLVLSKDFDAYPRVATGWKEVGTKEADGSFVWRQAVPPFRNTTSGRIDGLVGLAELENRSCTTCYDVTLHERMLANVGLFIANVSRFDVGSSSGKALALKYNVTQVPTVLVSSDAAAYGNFMQVWPQVGTREADGTFVFRNMQALPNVTVSNVTWRRVESVTNFAKVY